LKRRQGSEEVRASVIIPAYNAEKTLAQCLTACLNQTLPAHEIIVVDDGSRDDTARVAATFPVRCVRQDNAGPASARNHGAACAAGDIFVFTDADCIPEPDWLEQLLKGFEEDVAAVGGTYGIANPGSRLARMIYREIADRHARLPADVDFLGSFNVAYRREIFESLHGFDERFREASGEDNDLAYRIQDLGGRMRFMPKARVAHYHPQRLLPYLRTQMRHGFWRVPLYAKHPGRVRRGDRYAGLAELLLPPLMLGLAGGLPLAMVFDSIRWCWAGGAWLYLVLRAPLPYRLARRSRDPAMAAFIVVAALRDMARAVGMAAGIGRYLLDQWKGPSLK